MTAKKAVIIIPARLKSTRFPKKPFAKIAGTSLIERVWRIACASKLSSGVYIATDSEEIASHAKDFGAQVVLTSEECRTGTDRVYEASKQLGQTPDILINLQGDAVLTPPWIIDSLIAEFETDPAVQLATPMVKISGDNARALFAQKARGSNTGTLVVFDKNRNALYFSKGLIPHHRDGVKADSHLFLHVGLYGYRSATLHALANLKQGYFEQIEQLEQLRALENGISIRMVEVDLQGRTLASIDNPEDVAMAEGIISKEGELIVDLCQ